jgi:hypothetical protein
MATLHTRTVVSLLNSMSADGSLLTTARARQEVLRTLANAADGIALAGTVLSDKVYPPLSPRRRVGSDRRWRAAAAHLDHAASGAQHVQQLLFGAVARCHRLIRDGEIVEYHGSLSAAYGRYGIDGPCICEDCEDRGLTLQLHPVRGGHLLTCVNPTSISPLPAPDALAVHHGQVERLLSTGLDALPTPLDAEHALYYARSLAVVTNRTRTVVAGWRDMLARLFAPGWHWWSFDTEGGSPRHLERYILTAFDHADQSLPQVTADLRRAITTLAAIQAEPRAA